MSDRILFGGIGLALLVIAALVLRFRDRLADALNPLRDREPPWGRKLYDTRDFLVFWALLAGLFGLGFVVFVVVG